MNQEDSSIRKQIDGAESTDSSTLAKKPYASPVLTKFGQMNQLTKEGDGPQPNDGSDGYGQPAS